MKANHANRVRSGEGISSALSAQQAAQTRSPIPFFLLLFPLSFHLFSFARNWPGPDAGIKFAAGMGGIYMRFGGYVR